jgi:hypothetical protein
LKRGILLSIIIVILLINLVSALNACCEQTLDGEYCKYTDESDCNTNFQSTYATCEQTSYCQIGCCYSSDTGSCYKNTPKSRCEAETGSSWTSDLNCDIDQCTLGCCVIADQAFFVTEVKCKQTASQYEEVEMSFNDEVSTEYECLNTVKNSEWGCCVNEKEYTFTTRDSCETDTSTEVTVNFTEQGFQAGMLCSNDLLSGDCAKQQYTACYEGKIYWYDSCGNRENIYSSNKDSSYNEGYILSEDASCSVSGPYDKTCGNCDYAEGSTCGGDIEGIMPNGEYTCIDLTCEETFENDWSPAAGGDKLNGESWCIYDNIAGEGRDTVGSRHYRHLCINGEEITEPCTDFREELCIHGILTEDVLGNLEAIGLSGGDSGYIQAGCRENRVDECYSCNGFESDCSACNQYIGVTGDLTDAYVECCSSIAESESRTCCENEDYRDCHWIESTPVSIERGVTNKKDEQMQQLQVQLNSLGVCVPQVPPGIEFWAEDGVIEEDEEVEDAICSQADTKCTATYRIGGWNRLFGGGKTPDKWDLTSETPAGCTEANWYNSQNTICKSLGDCGAYKNFNNVITYDGFSSNAFDDKFFLNFDSKDNVIDASNWDYDQYLGEGGDINYGWSIKNKNLFANPIFAIGATSAVVGAIAQVDTCQQAKKADLEGTFQTADIGSLFGLGQGAASTAGGWLSAIQSGGTGGVTGIESITGNAAAEYHCSADYPGYTCESGTKSDLLAKYNNDCKSGNVCNDDTTTCCGTSSTLWCCNTGTTTDDDEEEEEKDPKKAPDGKLDEYHEICDKDSPNYDAESCEGLATELAEKAEAGSKLSPMEGITCFLQGAMPIAGLIGKPVKEKPSVIQDMIDNGNPLEKLIGGAKQKARAAKTTTQISNVVTTAAVAYLAVSYLNANETTINYEVECKPWQPPTGGTDCELCNNGDTPCSEYKCKSLGAACDLVNQGTDNETCISLNVNDVNSPLISPNEELLSTDYTLTIGTLEGAPGFTINELIPSFTPIQLGLTTDEPALCRWSTTPGTEFENMNQDFGSSLYLYNQALLFSLGDEVTDEEILALTEGIYTLYIRCSDAQGNANENDYFMRFQVDTTPDLSPPTIEFTSIGEGTYFAYGVNQTSIAVYTNEPAQCRWDTADTAYDVMQNEMECAQSGYQSSSEYYGTYPCTGTLDSVSEDEINYFYFRCMDNSGNTNEESYKYSTKASEDTLSITSFSPEGAIANSSVTIEATTEGGADDGRAICKFSTDSGDYSLMTEFLTTNSTKHEQELSLFPGEYTLYLTCQDLAGNQNSTSNEITMEYDESAPTISQFYIDEAFYSLVIQTDEPTTCEYASESFTFGEGTQMTGTLTTDHETSVGQLLYYVICEDEYGNQGSYLLDISLWT